METTKTIIVSVVSAALGSAATIAVGLFGYWNTDRSHDIEMVRISLSILGGENKDTSLNGRRFALRALEKYAGVEIPSDEFNDWAATGTIPIITSGGSPESPFIDGMPRFWNMTSNPDSMRELLSALGYTSDQVEAAVGAYLRGETLTPKPDE
ncbi:MAG: hypothetical protein JJ920_05260 [Roseitalea sp.]|nr:hypothetical protein [Roseitalea sp.]MBO6722524.1 hypothetical protein [Roseitalea sp.]MBO6742298.1 hypothetical protein [Roseitalea sp.]